VSTDTTAAALWVLLVVAVLIGPWALLTANRLDRLHVRTDAAWAALDAALARRAVVVRAVAAALCTDPFRSQRLRAAADRAEHAPRSGREAAENELSRRLAELDRGPLTSALSAELSDAGQRVMLARRVHNDAVRDTLALRQRRSVRWLRLAGTAHRPDYFEIAEPQPESHVRAASLPRRAARVLLVDPADRVLLFTGRDPAQPGESFWFTAGGGVEPGEQLPAAALREVLEETGIRLPTSALVGPVWRRHATFSFDGTTYDAEEWFFLARVDGAAGAVDTSGFTELETRTVHGHRWWHAEELRASAEAVYPDQLADLLPDLLAGPWDGKTRTVR
jgi:8-oxo-dGTP pyrophosphatase MutT (NUDIX family)